ncbi:MAG: 30S ribosomal protein S18 [Spirochaetes bacterium]|jgi:small subunit ribosomal protein S18|nr:30S ribosomal protein S18 [Spirochaetota bacterium]
MSEDIKDIESSEDVAAAMTGLERDDSFARAFKDKDGGRGRNSRFKKKVCKFCHNKDMVIDYKKSDILEKFLTERGKILPRRITGTCAKHQRHIALEVKRARMIALLPFVVKF